MTKRTRKSHKEDVGEYKYSVQEKHYFVDMCNIPLLKNQISKSSANAAQSGVLYQIYIIYKKVTSTLAKYSFVSYVLVIRF